MTPQAPAMEFAGREGEAAGEPRAEEYYLPETATPDLFVASSPPEGRPLESWVSEVQSRIAAWTGDASEPGAETVKETRRRTVLRFPAMGGIPAVYVKRERILGVWNRLRATAWRSHARREFDNAARLHELGIAAPRSVAFALWRERGFAARTISVLEELAGGVRLDEFFTSVPKEERRAAIADVATALARIHQREIDLTDCHRGNILVVPDQNATFGKLALLDVATVRFHRMGIGARTQRVGQLLHSLQATLTYEERRAFVERYARELGLRQGALEDFAREVRGAEQRIHRRRERSRDRRCLVESTEYWVSRRPRTRIHARREVTAATAELLAGVGRSATVLEIGGAKIVKSEGRNLCYLIKHDGIVHFVKRVDASSWFGALVDVFRGSRGKRAWRAAHALARRGVATPRALALVETGFLLPMRSALVMEEIPAAASLQDVAARFRELFPERAERAAFLSRLANAVAALHNFDVDHDDLATKNFLVRDLEDPTFFLIDLEAVCGWYRPLARDRVLRALMQLDDCPRTVSRTDRMRFLVAYEKATKIRFTRADIEEVRHMLRMRFAKSGRNYFATGPR
jgi:tRNA A-37 threonylcarbamoyl transferase component Bud32